MNEMHGNVGYLNIVLVARVPAWKEENGISEVSANRQVLRGRRHYQQDLRAVKPQ